VDALNAKYAELIYKSQFWAENLIDFEAEIIMQEVMFQVQIQRGRRHGRHGKFEIDSRDK